MAKLDELKNLEAEIAADRNLPLRESNLVFGEGSPDAEVMFIGEAPGFHEDRLGRPFVGMAGKLLDKLLTMVGWDRKDVYISNIVKRRPPENRDPLPEEIAAYKPYLARQIEIINPKAIVPLGRFSMNYFLPEAKISRDQGRVFIYQGRKVIPMLHPAAALRQGAFMKTLEESFKRLPDLITGHPPAGGPTISATAEPEKIPEKKKEPPPMQSLF
ncbi:MAG: uracil-DNA glycosylase [Candidatus Sungbacteria bacterium]|uniref:Type-4 uracil-DNA glycosylase n=1 Tax=Candidatus Sungiibacteriota bacterium TaxID=2750080 RepID=A0A9D6LRL3_9BACT|nr:uracil-DNA glycosylase [Candidatus Sungbacteria bacterium]